MTRIECLSRLPLTTLADLATSDNLTAKMKAAISSELRYRADKLEAERNDQSARAALSEYYAQSVGGSVLADYRSGNFKSI
tara:strand:- start:26 stop:268 length:243 start_codon:yes stop_codon:yes gene_type:complete